MSRFYLICFCFVFHCSFGQTEIKKFLTIAKEKYNNGDYINAIAYYDKAMEMDSNAIHVLWDYAETLKAYKDYDKAYYYYKKVYEREGAELFPNSLLNFALMAKQNEKYEEALELFKKAKKVYRNDRKSYAYLKSRQGFNSCVWAINNLKDTADVLWVNIPEKINSKNAEFAHAIFDGQLIFSSLRADSINFDDEVITENYKTKIYSSKITDGSFENEFEITSKLDENYDYGNFTLSLDKKRVYFSTCNAEAFQYKCQIYVGSFENGKISNIDRLGDIINEQGANTTMPHIAEFDGRETLFFSSDRSGGKGGMDIWYATIKDGNQYSTPKNIKVINSLDNELSPFWDKKQNELYFSSSWHEGFGGYDIFKSTFEDQFSKPENLGLPFNSPANDLYFFKIDSLNMSVWSSNRKGTNYSKNPTCCSDIFAVKDFPSPQPPTEKESLAELNKRLPVTLYFHNDVPNPRSRDTVTQLDYIETYNEYIQMLPKYKKEYAQGLKGEEAKDAADDIEDFFFEFVEQGVKDLKYFETLLLEELERGRKIRLVVKGFASPLANTDYNVNLTKRRINALENYMLSAQGGAFKNYIVDKNNPKLTFEAMPFGEYKTDNLISDNPNDKRNSVYSRAAALERKIEIQSVDIIRDEDSLIYGLKAAKSVINLGALSADELQKQQFILENIGESKIEEVVPNFSMDDLGVMLSKPSVLKGDRIVVYVQWVTETKAGMYTKTIFIDYDGAKSPLELTINYEVINNK